MPVSKLFVEGKLDAEIFGAILIGAPAVEAKGSKYGLKRIAREERSRNNIRYLRDRDYDYEVPAATNEPVIDTTYDDGSPLGWHWCRHELESYLLEPSLVAAATGWDTAEFEVALKAAARRLRFYQLARWVIGAAKTKLPPTHSLANKPVGLNKDFDLPSDLSEKAMVEWANKNIHKYYKNIKLVLAHRNVRVAIESKKTFFSRLPLTVEDALLWCSGKNLMAGLLEFLVSKSIAHPSTFRDKMRDWIIAHPDATLDYLPEWKNLITILRA